MKISIESAFEKARRLGGRDALNCIAELAENPPENTSDGPLAGVPVLGKDNIDVQGFHTTAGSLALADNLAAADAPIIRNLKKNGAVILGKTNMTEFANFTTAGMPSGYSSRGGQVVHALNPAINPSGSSTGSAVAVSAGIVSAAVCLLVSGLLMYRLKMIGGSKDVTSAKTEKITINPWLDLKLLIQNKDFVFLIIPNFLRGIGAGVVSMIALIAIRSVGMEDSDTPLLTTAGNIGSMLSSILYVYLVRRFGIPKTGLIGGCVFCLICLTPLGSTTSFLILYSAAYVGYIILSNAIPNMVYQAADQTIISRFHTWRLAITALGTAVGTPICGVLLVKVSPVVLLLIAAFVILLCTVGYYLCYYKRLNHLAA